MLHSQAGGSSKKLNIINTHTDQSTRDSYKEIRVNRVSIRIISLKKKEREKSGRKYKHNS
jgi:coproporphyrinogen III oxidase-like Fe-S oxidoreductase